MQVKANTVFAHVNRHTHQSHFDDPICQSFSEGVAELGFTKQAQQQQQQQAPIWCTQKSQATSLNTYTKHIEAISDVGGGGDTVDAESKHHHATICFSNSEATDLRATTTTLNSCTAICAIVAIQPAQRQKKFDSYLEVEQTKRASAPRLAPSRLLFSNQR